MFIYSFRKPGPPVGMNGMAAFQHADLLDTVPYEHSVLARNANRLTECPCYVLWLVAATVLELCCSGILRTLRIQSKLHSIIAARVHGVKDVMWLLCMVEPL